MLSIYTRTIIPLSSPMKRNNPMKQRNRKAGFSLAELLVVVLVLGLLTGITITGASAVKKSYDDIMLRAEAETLLSTTIIQVTDELRFAQEIEASEGTVTFLSGNLQKRIQFENSQNEGIMIIDIARDDKDPERARPLLPKRPLPQGEAETIDPVPAIESIAYDSAEQIVTVTIAINNNGKKVLEQELKISPLNSV